MSVNSCSTYYVSPEPGALAPELRIGKESLRASRQKKRGRRKLDESLLDIRLSDSSDSEASGSPSGSPSTCKRVLNNEFHKLVNIDGEYDQSNLDKVVSFQNLSEVGKGDLINFESDNKKDDGGDLKDMLMLRDEILELKEKIDHKIVQCDHHTKQYSEYVVKLEEDLESATCYSTDLKSQLKVMSSSMFSKTKEEESTGPAIQRFYNKTVEEEAPSFDTGIHKLEKYARINGIVDVEIELDSGTSSEDDATAEENTYSYDEKSEEKSEEKKSSDISSNETFHLQGNSALEKQQSKQGNLVFRKSVSNTGDKERHDVDSVCYSVVSSTTVEDDEYIATTEEVRLPGTLQRQYGKETIVLESGVEQGAELLKEHKDDVSSAHTVTPSKLDDMTFFEGQSIPSDDISRLEDSDDERAERRRAKRAAKGQPRLKTRAARGFFASICSCWHN